MPQCTQREFHFVASSNGSEMQYGENWEIFDRKAAPRLFLSSSPSSAASFLFEMSEANKTWDNCAALPANFLLYLPVP